MGDGRETERNDGVEGIRKYLTYMNARGEDGPVSIRSFEGKGGTFIEFVDSCGVTMRQKYEGDNVVKEIDGLVAMMRERSYVVNEGSEVTE